MAKQSEKAMSLHNKLGQCHPKLSRGRVWCHECGKTQAVNSGECLRTGWPECCGQTMSIDSPEEHAALSPAAEPRKR